MKSSGIIRTGAGLLLLAALAACTPGSAGEAGVGMLRGPAVPLGAGMAHAYVLLRDDVPYEIGVALSEHALEGLPGAHDPGGVHVAIDGHTTFAQVLDLPAGHGTPFRHVLLNWNPGGHEPPGIYDRPHIDFHFYLTDVEARLAIDPADPAFQRKATREPAPDLVPAGYIMPAPIGFPQMGVHWIEPSSPELNGETFTHTFIYGTWDGELIFGEPMITRDFLLSRQTVELPVPQPQRYDRAGYYPTGYRVGWHEGRREHQVALTGFELRR